jgi:hypothetical protein
MSVHLFPYSIEQDPVAVDRLCRVYLGREPVITTDGTNLTLTFTPDLTAPQITTLGQLVRVAGLMRITPAEWEATAADRATLASFLAIGSPTLAQTHAAVKALVRTLRVLVRD